MKLTTLGVVTLGLLPPMAPGRIEPVSLYLERQDVRGGAAILPFLLHLASILETHPRETLSCLEMSQGLIPSWASSMILTRT